METGCVNCDETAAKNAKKRCEKELRSAEKRETQNPIENTVGNDEHLKRSYQSLNDNNLHQQGEQL